MGDVSLNWRCSFILILQLNRTPIPAEQSSTAGAWEHYVRAITCSANTVEAWTVVWRQKPCQQLGNRYMSKQRLIGSQKVKEETNLVINWAHVFRCPKLLCCFGFSGRESYFESRMNYANKLLQDITKINGEDHAGSLCR